VPSGGKNLTEITSTFSTGYETAANIVPAGKLKLHPPLPSWNSRSNRTECRDAAPAYCTLWNLGAF
jgi:hypothetical protein